LYNPCNRSVFRVSRSGTYLKKDAILFKNLAVHKWGLELDLKLNVILFDDIRRGSDGQLQFLFNNKWHVFRADDGRALPSDTIRYIKLDIS
jgi:hypothetical protein